MRHLPPLAFDHDEIARYAIERMKLTPEYRKHVR